MTQQAGRGVGMDVVAVEVKKLGGALHMESERGRGTHFTIRLPFTLAISHALVVRTGDEYYALPLPTVEGVVRLTREEVMTHLHADSASFNHGGQKYRLQPLQLYVGMEPSPLPDQDVTIPVSYTHLDVYKRQVSLANLMCSIGSMTTARRTLVPIIAPYEAKTPVAAYRERAS